MPTVSHSMKRGILIIIPSVCVSGLLRELNPHCSKLVFFWQPKQGICLDLFQFFSLAIDTTSFFPTLFLIFIRNAHLKTFEYTSRNKVPMCFQQFKLVSVHASQVSGVTGLWHHTQFLLVKMESCEPLPRLSSNHEPPNLCLLSS